MEQTGELTAHLIKYTLSLSPHFSPFFPRLPSLPSPPCHPLSLLDMPTLPQGRLWVLCMFLLSFSVGIHPMHYSLVSSIIFSCVVMGISISLLLSEEPSMNPSDGSSNPASKWRQPPDPNQNPKLTPREYGPFFADADEYRHSEILAVVSSALNFLVATAL